MPKPPQLSFELGDATVLARVVGGSGLAGSRQTRDLGVLGRDLGGLVCVQLARGNEVIDERAVLHEQLVTTPLKLFVLIGERADLMLSGSELFGRRAVRSPLGGQRCVKRGNTAFEARDLGASFSGDSAGHHRRADRQNGPKPVVVRHAYKSTIPPSVSSRVVTRVEVVKKPLGPQGLPAAHGVASLSYRSPDWRTLLTIAMLDFTIMAQGGSSGGGDGGFWGFVAVLAGIVAGAVILEKLSRHDEPQTVACPVCGTQIAVWTPVCPRCHSALQWHRPPHQQTIS